MVDDQRAEPGGVVTVGRTAVVIAAAVTVVAIVVVVEGGTVSDGTNAPPAGSLEHATRKAVRNSAGATAKVRVSPLIVTDPGYPPPRGEKPRWLRTWASQPSLVSYAMESCSVSAPRMISVKPRS